ncbi:MAG: hypothetical protein ACLFTK_02360 [Anaerolineales bacterium]
MAYSIFYPWRKHPRLIHLIFYDQLSVDEVGDALNTLHDILVGAQMPMHILFSFIEIHILEPPLINVFTRHPALRDPQLGYVLFVDLGPRLQTLAHEIDNKLGAHIKYVADEDDAWEFFNLMGIC